MNGFETAAEELEFLAGEFRRHGLAGLTRDAFYRLSPACARLVREQGFRQANEAAARFLETVVDNDFRAALARTRAGTLETLSEIADAAPRTALDDGIRALCDGDLAAAARAYAVVHGGRIADIRKYLPVATTGDDPGFAVWQLMNPFFHLWRSLAVTRDAVSERWRDTVFETPSPVPPGNGPWRPTVSQASMLRFLDRTIGRSVWSAARVLECGSGNGESAQLLVRGLGVDPRRYHAFDLHDGRVAATRAALTGIDPALDPEGLGRRVVAVDMLAPDAGSRLAAIGPINIVFSASFTNVFDDAQLDRVLATLAALGPRHIVDVSVISSWGLCIGRADPSPFYARVGYTRLASEYETPRLGPGDGHRLWMPERYWSNRNVIVFTRADRA